MDEYQATFTFADDGYKYVGEHKDGKPHGQGTWTLANGTKFVGEWEEGKKHGKFAIISSADGKKRFVKFKDGEFDGL